MTIGIGRQRAAKPILSNRIRSLRSDQTNLGFRNAERLSSEPRACQVSGISQTSNPQDKTSEDRINDKPRIARGRRRGSMMISMADLCGGKRYRVDVVFQGLVEERPHPAAKSQAPHSLVYHSSSLTTTRSLHHGTSSRTRCSAERQRDTSDDPSSRT